MGGDVDGGSEVSDIMINTSATNLSERTEANVAHVTAKLVPDKTRPEPDTQPTAHRGTPNLPLDLLRVPEGKP
jgi:hypothetical protein